MCGQGMTPGGEDWGPWPPPVWSLIPWVEVGEKGVLPSQGRGIFLSHFTSVLLTHFLLSIPRAVAWLQCCTQGLVAGAAHAWNRLPLAVANPGAVDVEAGASQIGACACGVLLPGQGDQQVLHALPDPNPCITAAAGATGAGPWCSSHSLQTGFC